jgi:tetratricopeptide (TPR) repeat protein
MLRAANLRSYINPPPHACSTMGMTEGRVLMKVALVLALLAASIPGVLAVTITSSGMPPTTAAGWYDLGNSYVNEKRYDGALYAYDQAIAADPAYARAYFAKGQVLAILGMHAEALDSYGQAIVLDPGLAPVVDTYQAVSEGVVYPDIPSGSLLKGYWVSGYYYLVIDNQQGSADVVVALAPSGNNAASVAVYVKKGYVNEFDGIVPPGTYSLYVTTGEKWNSVEDRFDQNPMYFRWDLPQYAYGANGFGYTMVFVGQQYIPSWYIYNLQSIPPEEFPSI